MLITLILIFLLILYGFFLINGKGYSLIAGFNAKSDEELKEYDVVAVCKFVGKIMFSLAFSMMFWILGDYYELIWVIILGFVLFIGIFVFYVVYIQNWKRFKR